MGSHMIKNSTVALLLCVLLVSQNAQASNQQNQALSIEGEVGIEYGNDSNVVVEEIDLTSSFGDTFFKFRGKGSAEYRFTDEHSASVSLSLTDRNYADAEAFDLQTVLFTSGYKFKHEDVTLGLDYRHASAELGGNDFLTLTQISPSASFFLSKKNFFRLAYTNIQKELDNNPARDADSHEYALDYYFFWKGLNDYFISSVKFRQEEAEEALFNYDGYQLRFAYKKRYEMLDFKSRITLDLRYRERDYNDLIDPSLADFRKDTRRTITFNKEVELTAKLSALIDIAHIDNQSNLENLDYNETIISTGLEYQF